MAYAALGLAEEKRQPCAVAHTRLLIGTHTVTMLRNRLSTGAECCQVEVCLLVNSENMPSLDLREGCVEIYKLFSLEKDGLRRTSEENTTFPEQVWDIRVVVVEVRCNKIFRPVRANEMQSRDDLEHIDLFSILQ